MTTPAEKKSLTVTAATTTTTTTTTTTKVCENYNQLMKVSVGQRFSERVWLIEKLSARNISSLVPVLQFLVFVSYLNKIVDTLYVACFET